MDTYLLVKSLHILSAIVLFGTGLGSAFYKYMADRQADPVPLAMTNRHVILADWWFTTPTIIIQPLTGFWLMHRLGLDLDTAWIRASLLLYVIAGVCWVPVVYLQIRMHGLARHAAETQTPLPADYRRQARIWFWLGVPAFASMLGIVLLMVFKPT